MVSVPEVTGLQWSCNVSVPEVTGFQWSCMVNVPELTGFQWSFKVSVPEVTGLHGVAWSVFLRCRPPMELHGQCS